jgi:hypothetical protein
MKHTTYLLAGIACVLAAGGLPSDAHAESPGLELVATIPEPDLIPEGIAFDAATRTLYVSSIRKRKIVALSPEGKSRDFVASRQDGIWSVLGMKIDPERRTLLACSEVDGPGMEGFSPADAGKSAVFSSTSPPVRPSTSSRARRASPLQHLVFTRRGVMYVTDSAEGSVWRIDRGSGRVANTRARRTLRVSERDRDRPGERTILWPTIGRSTRSISPPERGAARHPPRTRLGRRTASASTAGARRDPER